MRLSFLFPVVLVAFYSLIWGNDIVEINSSKPYSSGLIEFGNEDIHFSTGLTLKWGDGVSSVNFGTTYYLYNPDSSLYTSYACNENDYIDTVETIWGDEWDVVINYGENINWIEIDTVDTSVNQIDYAVLVDFDDINKVHTVGNYFPGEFGQGAHTRLSEGYSNILISEDSLGNYIKWQIIIDDELIHSYLRWAIDSCGNGRFIPDNVSNINKHNNYQRFQTIKHSIQNSQLIFSSHKDLSITLFKLNGQMIKTNNAIGNRIDISDISKGIYFVNVSIEGIICTVKIKRE